MLIDLSPFLQKKRGRNEVKYSNMGVLPEGKEFSKENQPTGEAKSLGRRKALAIKKIASSLITGELKTALKDLAFFMGIEPDQIDVETAMHLKQMEKALKNGDTHAYNAVLDRIKGKPIQQIQYEEIDITPTKYIDATKDNG